MYLIAGLGNPGPEYEITLHNMGFHVIEALAQKLNVDAMKRKKKCDAHLAETTFNGSKLILAQPQTFMNNSGVALQELLQWYKINPSHLILIYDDVDLEAGQIRIRQEGSAGGHHGVESVIQRIGTANFPRVRVGIGRPKSEDVTNYVLSKIPKEEKFTEAINSAADAVLDIISNGLSSAMNKYNK